MSCPKIYKAMQGRQKKRDLVSILPTNAKPLMGTLMTFFAKPRNGHGLWPTIVGAFAARVGRLADRYGLWLLGPVGEESGEKRGRVAKKERTEKAEQIQWTMDGTSMGPRWLMLAGFRAQVL